MNHVDPNTVIAITCAGAFAVTTYVIATQGQGRGSGQHHSSRHRSSRSQPQQRQPRPQSLGIAIPAQNSRQIVQFSTPQSGSTPRAQQQRVRRYSSDPTFTPIDPPMVRRQQILFYHRHQPHYGFTNFSAHPVIYGKKTYPTSEHLFQAFKFMKNRPDISEHIRTISSNPRDAFDTARKYKHDVRPDWLQVNIKKMEEVVFAKFTQHAELCNELLGTGDAELVEDSDRDSFWGWGADRKGRNELGKALMKLRTQLREHPPFSPRE